MFIISQRDDSKELTNTISAFFNNYKNGDLLRKCNGCKQKGIPALDSMKYKLCNIFRDRSMYMQIRTGSFREGFSGNTFYRFLNPQTNWLKFTALLFKRIADTIEPLTSEDRINAFIVDDRLFSKTSCKANELAVKVFDHCDMHYKKGLRLMTLCWTDDNTTLPVNGCLLPSTNEKNVLGPESKLINDHWPAKSVHFQK